MAQRVPVMEGTFVENAEGGRLLANKCKSCGRVFFPKAVFCLACLGRDMEDLELSRRGKLYSFTTGRMPSAHFQPPYVVGYIDMPEKVRIFAPIEAAQGKTLRMGMEMELSIEKLWDEEGKEVIGWRFRPV